MNISKIIYLILISSSICFSVSGQKIDSLDSRYSIQGEVVSQTNSEHSPNKAMVYEMILPGLGHIYNKKIWHIPFTYAAFATTIFFIIDNTKKYHKYANAYADFSIYKRYLENPAQFPISDKEPQQQRFREVLNADYQTYSSTQLKYFQDALKRNKDQFKKYRDLSYILLGASYLVNILWAVVDAHFFDYDISKDLSLHIEPQINITPNLENYIAINMVINF